MNDTWDDRKKALEDSYFDTLNKQAIERIKNQGGAQRKRLSPVTGKPMEQTTIMGVVVDRCVDSGGIWLDSGELEEILKHAQAGKEGEGRIAAFMSKLLGK